MNYTRLIELIHKKQYGKLSSDEGYELLRLLQIATDEQRSWCHDWC